MTDNPHPKVEPEKKHRSRKKLAMGIILAALAISGLAGYLVYDNAVQHVKDRTNAMSAAENLRVTCSSGTTATGTVTIGVTNPSNYPMDATWNITIDFPGGSHATSTQSFHVEPNTVAYPKWTFRIPIIIIFGDDLYTYSVNGSFKVQGNLGSYDFSRH